MEGKFIGLALAGPPHNQLQKRQRANTVITFVKKTLARQRHQKKQLNGKLVGSCWTIVLCQKDWYQYHLFSTECHGETFAEEGHPALSNTWGADWGWRQPTALLLGSRHGVCSPIRFWVWLTWDFCTPSPLDSKIAEWVSNYNLSQKMTGAGTNCLFSMFFFGCVYHWGWKNLLWIH